MGKITLYKGFRLDEYTIEDIESLNEWDAFTLCEDVEEIKGHKLYFVDFGGYFGFAGLVFAEGQHIRFLDDFELHHKNKAREELKALFIRQLEKKTFTEEEIKEPIRSYDDFKAKLYFLQNYFGMRRPHLSAFEIVTTAAQEKAYEEARKGKIFSPLFMASYDPKDADIIEKGNELYKALCAAKRATLDNAEYWKAAFIGEMYNHEYAINWQGDYDVISAFANVDRVKDYENIEKLFKAAGFNKTQKAAYLAARAEYVKSVNA